MNIKKTICSAIFILIIAAAVIGLIFIKGAKIGSSIACVYSDGKLIRSIELKPGDDYTFEVRTADGQSNTVIVKGAKIGVSDATCPDKICVNTPYISDGIQPIVCMPNKLVIQIEAKKPDNYEQNS